MSDSKWKQLVKKQKSKEVRIIVLLTIILIIGIVGDIVAACGRHIYTVPNYDAVSLAVIQIQATVFTLTIALIALLGGRITDEFLGVKYNNFIMNIKPFFLTQKRIISLLLILLVMNVFFHMFSCYNTVIAIFVITVVLVAYSASAIYEAFVGTEQIDEEVQTLVEYSFTKKDIQASVFAAFCKQWIRECTLQENGDFESYLEVFKKGFSELIKTDSTRSTLLDNCSALLRQLLKKNGTVMRGINTLEECYELAWLFIRDNRSSGDFSLFSQKVPFYLFENTYYELRDAMINMRIRDVEKSFRWGSFTELILLVDMYIGYNTEDPSQNSELKCIEEFGGFMGYYISPKCSGENAVERSNIIWGGPLSRLYSYSSLPDHLKSEGERVLANRNFRFMVSQIQFDNTSIVKEYLYTRALHNCYKLSQSYALMVLKYHCYLYYMAEFETVNCISQDLKNRAIAFLEDNQIVKVFKAFLVYVSERDKNVFHFGGSNLDLFNCYLIDKLVDELRLFEFYPHNGDAKVVVMDYAVQHFVLFISAFIANYYNIPELLDRVISEEQSTGFYIDFISKKDHRAEMKRFLRLMGVEDSRIEDKTDACYASLINCIKDKYKSHSIHEAEKAEKVLDKEFIEKKDDLSAKIKDYLESELNGIMGASDGEACYAVLMSISTFSDQGIESILDDHYDWCFNQFVCLIANKLYKNSKIRIVSRRTFDTDDELLEYIINHKDSVIVGSEFALRSKDFSRRNEFVDAIHAAEHYTTGAHGVTLVLNKNSMRISIKKVRIGKHIPAVYETNAKYDKETNMYSYEVSSGMPIDFTKEELQNYLNNTRRVVDIIIHFDIEVADGVIGDVVQEDIH